MNIERITSEEVASILPLVREMLDQIGHIGGLQEEHFVKLLAAAIAKDTAVVCVEKDHNAECVGVVGAFLLEDGFSKEPMAYTWFSHKASSGLYRFFDENMTKKGVKTIFIAHINGHEDGETDVFNAMGYKVARTISLWARRLPDA